VKLNVYRVVMIALTLASTVFVVWNAVDEWWQLENWTGVCLVSLAWLFIPYCVVLIGVFAKNWTRRTICLIISVLFTALFLPYALNGPTSERPEGTQHMHLYFVPFLMGFVVLLLACGKIVANAGNRAVARLSAKSEAPETSEPERAKT